MRAYLLTPLADRYQPLTSRVITSFMLAAPREECEGVAATARYARRSE